MNGSQPGTRVRMTFASHADAATRATILETENRVREATGKAPLALVEIAGQWYLVEPQVLDKKTVVTKTGQTQTQETGATTMGRSSELTDATKQLGRGIARQVVSEAAKRIRTYWTSAGEFLEAVVKAGKHPTLPGRADARLQKAPLGQHDEDGASGGWLVPAEFVGDLITRRLTEPDSVLGLCKPYRLKYQVASVPGLQDADKSAAATRYGGVVAYWSRPGYAPTLTSARLRAVNFMLADLVVQVPTTDEMIEDVENLGDLLADVSGYAIADTLLEAVLFGDGLGKPLGAFVGPDVLTISKEAGQAAASVVSENISKMWAALPLPLRDSAVWVCNPDVEAVLDKLAAIVVAGSEIGFQMYVPPGAKGRAHFGTIKGRPVVPTDHCPAIGTAGDIALGAFGAYGLAIKSTGVQSAISAHVEFLTEQSVLRYKLRVDGKSLWNETVTPAAGATTRAPFVVIETRV